jgi:protein O-GlcNAc transferase
MLEIQAVTIPQAFQIAVQHHQAGRLADAETLYRRILTLQPNHADALHLLGVIALQAGRHDLAVQWIRQAIRFNPNHPDAYSNLGEACRAIGRLDEAVEAFRRALQLNPDLPEAHNDLGNALRERGQTDEAVAAFHHALQLKPNFPQALNDLGNALTDQGQLCKALTALRHALQLKPDFPDALNNLGNAFKGQSQFDEAVAAYRRALELKPEFPEALNNLGSALKDQGELNEAVAAFRHALRIKPDYATAHSNLIYTHHFHPAHDNQTISEERQRWNRQFGEPLKRFVLPHANDRSPDRRLRVGYVSPEFRDHVTGRYLLPLFQCHDRSNIEIFCYAETLRSDQFTEGFRQRSHQWRSTVGITDEALAEMIRQDGVDILVDLTQHLAGNRLPMFARKPAPVQTSFTGYPDSAGLDAIEYRISDPLLEGDSADAGTGQKERVCLIESFWCYDPCGVELEVNEAPANASGKITFGCLNNFYKINERMLKLWAIVLGKVTNSRLVLLSNAGSHRERTLEFLEREGVNAHRVDFVEFRPRAEYLELYHRLDIALDTFPYNGHTTSMDALWMGVPVVSLAGDTPVSRAGRSLLTNLGLPELVARSDSGYVDIAERLAVDLSRLSELRSTLRDRMKNSVLMDAPRFARQAERAYRQMWRAWCSGQWPVHE